MTLGDFCPKLRLTIFENESANFKTFKKVQNFLAAASLGGRLKWDGVRWGAVGTIF